VVVVVVGSTGSVVVVVVVAVVPDVTANVVDGDAGEPEEAPSPYSPSEPEPLTVVGGDVTSVGGATGTLVDSVGADWVTTGREGATTWSVGLEPGGSEVAVVGTVGSPTPRVWSCTSRGNGTLAELSAPSAAATEPVVKTMAASPGTAHHGNFIGATCPRGPSGSPEA
jgi:hypothetical protein